MLRLFLAIFWLLPALALGQAPGQDKDDGKVSNDQPGRPLQMPPASSEVKEAFDDFERFQRRGAWERALKALYAIPDAQAERFVDGENGFIIPVARKRRDVLAAMSPEGQAAYRLFYDAEAKKLLDDAEGASERKNLERIYSAYFLSSSGDDAADRLGDLYFELGHFDRAADCWLAVVRDRPDTDLSPALLSLKAALALARAGRGAELAQIRTELSGRYADETLSLGGRTGRPAALLDQLVGEAGPAAPAARAAASAADRDLDPAPGVDPVWQMRFAESVEAGMTAPELVQWESNPISAVVPAVAVEGTRLLANYLGHVFAIDLKTGKLLWRSSSFHNLELSAMQQQARMLDASRFAIVAHGEFFWTLARDLNDQTFNAPFRLTCRRVDGGEAVWSSADLSDYGHVDFVGPPFLAGGKLFVAAKSQGNPQQPQMQNQPHQLVMAIEPHDGKVLWSTEVGVFRQGPQYFYYYGAMDNSPQPRLFSRSGALYVDTHIGVLARLDADTGTLDWGYGYHTDDVQGQNRFFFYPGMMQEAGPGSSAPLPMGEALLVKGSQSDRLAAVDPNRMKVVWDRQIAKTSRMLAADDRVLYLGGPDLSALDLVTRKLRWATRLPGGSMDARVLVRDGGIWQLTPRGIFEIDPATGTVRRIYRGSDLGAVGGDLFLTGPWLVAVSNRTIAAYARRPEGAAVNAPARQGETKKGEAVE